MLEVMLKLLLLGFQLLELIAPGGVLVDAIGQLAFLVVVCDELLHGVRGVTMAAGRLDLDRGVSC